MQSADLLAGKEGTADPTELIELIDDLAELEDAGAVADAAADARVAPEVKSQLEDARPKTSGLITHACRQSIQISPQHAVFCRLQERKQRGAQQGTKQQNHEERHHGYL